MASTEKQDDDAPLFDMDCESAESDNDETSESPNKASAEKDADTSPTVAKNNPRPHKEKSGSDTPVRRASIVNVLAARFGLDTDEEVVDEGEDFAVTINADDGEGDSGDEGNEESHDKDKALETSENELVGEAETDSTVVESAKESAVTINADDGEGGIGGKENEGSHDMDKAVETSENELVGEAQSDSTVVESAKGSAVTINAEDGAGDSGGKENEGSHDMDKGTKEKELVGEAESDSTVVESAKETSEKENDKVEESVEKSQVDKTVHGATEDTDADKTHHGISERDIKPKSMDTSPHQKASTHNASTETTKAKSEPKSEPSKEKTEAMKSNKEEAEKTITPSSKPPDTSPASPVTIISDDDDDECQISAVIPGKVTTRQCPKCHKQKVIQPVVRPEMATPGVHVHTGTTPVPCKQGPGSTTTLGDSKAPVRRKTVLNPDKVISIDLSDDDGNESDGDNKSDKMKNNSTSGQTDAASESITNKLADTNITDNASDAVEFTRLEKPTEPRPVQIFRAAGANKAIPINAKHTPGLNSATGQNSKTTKVKASDIHSKSAEDTITLSDDEQPASTQKSASQILADKKRQTDSIAQLQISEIVGAGGMMRIAGNTQQNPPNSSAQVSVPTQIITSTVPQTSMPKQQYRIVQVTAAQPVTAKPGVSVVSPSSTGGFISNDLPTVDENKRVISLLNTPKHQYVNVVLQDGRPARMAIQAPTPSQQQQQQQPLQQGPSRIVLNSVPATTVTMPKPAGQSVPSMNVTNNIQNLNNIVMTHQPGQEAGGMIMVPGLNTLNTEKQAQAAPQNVMLLQAPDGTRYAVTNPTEQRYTLANPPVQLQDSSLKTSTLLLVPSSTGSGYTLASTAPLQGSTTWTIPSPVAASRVTPDKTKGEDSSKIDSLLAAYNLKGNVVVSQSSPVAKQQVKPMATTTQTKKTAKPRRKSSSEDASKPGTKKRKNESVADNDDKSKRGRPNRKAKENANKYIAELPSEHKGESTDNLLKDPVWSETLSVITDTPTSLPSSLHPGIKTEPGSAATEVPQNEDSNGSGSLYQPSESASLSSYGSASRGTSPALGVISHASSISESSLSGSNTPSNVESQWAAGFINIQPHIIVPEEPEPQHLRPVSGADSTSTLPVVAHIQSLANPNLPQLLGHSAASVPSPGIPSPTSISTARQQQSGNQPISLNLTNAQQVQTGNQNTSISLTNAKQVRFKCNVCKQSFKSKPEFQDHLLVTRCTNPFYCHLCNQSTPYYQKFLNHIRASHGNGAFYPCCCKKQFMSYSSLYIHARHCTAAGVSVILGNKFVTERDVATGIERMVPAYPTRNQISTDHVTVVTAQTHNSESTVVMPGVEAEENTPIEPKEEPGTLKRKRPLTASIDLTEPSEPAQPDRTALAVGVNKVPVPRGINISDDNAPDIEEAMDVAVKVEVERDWEVQLDKYTKEVVPKNISVVTQSAPIAAHSLATQHQGSTQTTSSLQVTSPRSASAKTLVASSLGNRTLYRYIDPKQFTKGGNIGAVMGKPPIIRVSVMPPSSSVMASATTTMVLPGNKRLVPVSSQSVVQKVPVSPNYLQNQSTIVQLLKTSMNNQQPPPQIQPQITSALTPTSQKKVAKSQQSSAPILESIMISDSDSQTSADTREPTPPPADTNIAEDYIDLSKPQYKCTMCAEMFSYQMHLQHHYGTVHKTDGGECQCFICQRKAQQAQIFGLDS